jgi:hypothetical protein
LGKRASTAPALMSSRYPPRSVPHGVWSSLETSACCAKRSRSPASKGWARTCCGESSTAESTSQLGIALTVEADRSQQAISLATVYAKAVRRGIPSDARLPTRGIGARRAEGGPGPMCWPLIGALVGLIVGAALAIVSDGVRRGSTPVASVASLWRCKFAPG